MNRIVVAVFVVCLAGLLPAGTQASPGPHLGWGSEIAASNCDGGKLVINVKQTIVNSVDSKVGGGYWAFSDYHRQIQVRQVDANTFCATVQYEGTVTTIAGPSPANIGVVSQGTTATFQGGYLAEITGTFNPAWDTRGNIGTFDYACSAAGVCPGFVDWVAQYFPGYGFAYEWWGWIYRAGNNGTWVNASTGNEGDITS